MRTWILFRKAIVVNIIKRLARWVLREEIAHEAMRLKNAQTEVQALLAMGLSLADANSELMRKHSHYKKLITNLKSERRIRAPKLP